MDTDNTNNPNSELLNSISQIIKDEVSQVKVEVTQIIKDEVSELRNEMNARFDEVDTQLDGIKYDLKEAFKDIAIGQDRMEEHVAMYHVRGTVMQAMQQK